MCPEIDKSEEDWKAALSADRYHVLREKGTEPAWTGALLDVHDPGLFRCAGCGAELFRTERRSSVRTAAATWVTSSPMGRRPPVCATA